MIRRLVWRLTGWPPCLVRTVDLVADLLTAAVEL